MASKQLSEAAIAATTAAQAAISLATKTAATAEALAAAKVASDIASAVIAADIGYIKLDLSMIKTSLKELSEQSSKYVTMAEFTFWRGILVSGLLMTIALGVIMNFLKN